ncbi:serine hydrolase domain-containing protein [Nocardiopsis suaedae]|uniref:Serine hydrolase n=1 Tax=Nocardiopsis suaedae TaxID=3018444 RepID=A0ABT4TK18_9ACTN|nr:serine hydrolase domain-containing protein [Nocardiopsis suaedae]MDA2804604.1 serine hydrolase [Nocardiopsis suaedae]
MPFPTTAPAAAALALAIPAAITLSPMDAASAAVYTAPSAPAASADGTPDAEAVRAFLDERVPALMDEYGVPGVGVSVVGGGEVLVADGYGSADLESGEPVDPDRTAFPTASIAKSFVGAALVSLAEQGGVDLDADVNTYLPEAERVPDDPRGPVTVHHLLTHTAGFAEQLDAMDAPSEAELLPLDRYVAEYRPERIHPPGRYTGYSNYGYAMAGRIIEEVTGEPYGAYIGRTLFEPLGMDRTAFGDPDTLGERLEIPSVYGAGEGGREPLEHEHINPSPAGGAFSTPADMGVFMLELLRDRPAGQDVLADGAVRTMLDRQAANDPRLTGSGYGVWEVRTGDPRVVGHGGDSGGLHTEYAIVPEDGGGIHVAANGDGTAEGMFTLRDDLVREYLEEFHGAAPPVPGETGAANAADRAADGGLERYTGTYSMTRIPHREPALVFYSALQLRVRADGGRLVTADPMSGTAEWTPAGDGVFRSEEGRELVFIEEGGAITAAGFADAPVNAFERVPWYRDALLQGTAAAIALVLALSALAWPAAAGARLLRGRRTAEASPMAVGARLAAGLAGALSAALVAGSGIALAVHGFGPGTPLFPPYPPLLMVPMTAALPLTAAAAVLTVPAWVRGWWGPTARIHFTLVVAALALLSALALAYGLVVLPGL